MGTWRAAYKCLKGVDFLCGGVDSGRVADRYLKRGYVMGGRSRFWECRLILAWICLKGGIGAYSRREG